jgi:glycosyltransferase involved in cell wall biosynthesis
VHVLFISMFDFKSKGIVVIRKTAEAYAKSGHAVTYITYRDTDRNYAYEPVVEPEGVRVMRLYLPLGRMATGLPRQVYGAVQRLRLLVLFVPFALYHSLRAARRQPVDILYGMGVWGVLTAHLVRLWLRVPVVARYLGTVLYPPLKHGGLWRPAHWDHLLALKLPADLTIMTDDGTRGDVVFRSVAPPERRFRFWRNGVDTEPCRPSDERRRLRHTLAIPEHRPIVLAVSRLVPWKRVDRAIDAMVRLRALPVSMPVLVIVGEGEARAALQGRARTAGVDEDVLFVGALPHEDVWALYHEADVFLSLYDLSNVGNPLLEALSCGKAIITLANGDTACVITDGANGVLLPVDGDVPGRVAETIATLLRDATFRQRLQAGARAYAARHLLSWQERLSREVAEVEGLVAASQSESPCATRPRREA